jgi:hypothetical protein
MPSAVPPSHRTRGLRPLPSCGCSVLYVLHSLYRSHFLRIRWTTTYTAYTAYRTACSTTKATAVLDQYISLFLAHPRCLVRPRWASSAVFASPDYNRSALSHASAGDAYCRTSTLRDKRHCSTTWLTNSHLGRSFDPSLVWC